MLVNFTCKSTILYLVLLCSRHISSCNWRTTPSAERQKAYTVGQTDTFHQKKSTITNVLNEKKAGKKGGNRMKRRVKAEKSRLIHLLNYSFIKQLINTYSVPSIGDKMGKGRVPSPRESRALSNQG